MYKDKKWLKIATIVIIAVILAAAIVLVSIFSVIAVNKSNYLDYINAQPIKEGEILQKLWSDDADVSNDIYPSIEVGGEAQLLLFSDLHFGNLMRNEDFLYDAYINQDNETYKEIGKAIDSAQPDLVLFLGDTIESYDNAAELVRLCEFMESKKIYWSYIFGNADGDCWDNPLGNRWRYRADKMAMVNILTNYKYSIFDIGYTNFAEDAQSLGNSIINMTREGQQFYSIVTMDSNSYYKSGDNWLHDGYRPAQVEWYNQATSLLNNPHMIMTHMPISEYRAAHEYNNMKGWIDTQGRDTDIFQYMKSNKCTDMFAGHIHPLNYDMAYEGIGLHFNRTGNLKVGTPKSKSGYKTVIIDANNKITVSSFKYKQ